MEIDVRDTNTLADALPKEIKRVQEKIYRWKGYEKDMKGMPGNPIMFGPAIAMMQAEVNEGIDALASGDVARMINAFKNLKSNSDDD